ncbi:hypothetical protein [Polynucleobacter sp. 80A-SIGWE]|uniref:hypothetical protein n=1 Tax=Polynucleobacter sp. 80A-SIGWE TaxID=2689100 RepID=UPI001C0AF936|nr:hypothetical protein [Polynucleobacter sp. 80A-SIGWE]MBU3589513.1 hypothetical protein [Polynucleobacter sp. 80A-SIGWE]
MKIKTVTAMIPNGWPHSIQNTSDKKIICENLLEEAIRQINSENRNPSKWELDRLTEALKAIKFGNYAQASYEVISAFAPKEKIANGEMLSLPISDHHLLNNLGRELARLKGEPPRIS